MVDDNQFSPSPEVAAAYAAVDKAPEPARSPATMPPAPAPQGPVNVINPEGALVSIPGERLQEALDSGYQQASQDHVDQYFKEQKYGTTGQQIITGLEGAADAATFGAAGAITDLADITTPEDRLARREVNPGSRMVGQGLGLLGSALIPGVGAGSLLTRAGEGVGAAVGLGAEKAIAEAGAEAAANAAAAGLTGKAARAAISAAKNLAGAEFSTAAKVGSAAVKGVVENGLFQAGDEVSKMLAKDPNQSVQTAMADIGLASLIGGGVSGALGTVSPLWNATLGRKTDGMLRAITNKMGGIEGAEATTVDQMVDKAGIEIAPEIRGALQGDPYVQQASQILQDSATSSGTAHQEALKAFKGQLSDSVVSTMGKTPEELNALQHLSENQVGESIKESLSNTLKEAYTPIAKSYENISNRFKATEIPQSVRSDLGEALTKVLDPGVSMESSEAKLVQRVLKEVPGLQNLEQLRNYASGLGNETSGIAKQELWGVARKLRSAFSDAEDKTLTEVIGAEAPELSAEHAATKAAYKDLRNTIGDLNDRLKVGVHAGPKTFLNALNDMDGEAVLRRLSPKGKADIIGELTDKFPGVAQQVKDYHLNSLLKTAAQRAGEGETLNTKALLKSINGLSPEMRQFVLPPGAAEKLEAIDGLMERIPSKVGRSGTPEGLDGLMSWTSGSAAAAATMLLGHNPATAAGVGYITKLLSRDIPDAVRLGLLKFLGSSSSVDAEGFKAMVDMIQHTIQGENLLSKATKNVFKAGQEVLPQAVMPSEKDIRKLDKRLKEVQEDPNLLHEVGGKSAHYLPDHGTAMGQVAATSVQYLNSLRPNVDKRSPLDTQAKANPVQQAAFDRALTIAQQPLSIVAKIKAGTVQPQDIAAIKTMYPALYDRITEKLTNEMVSAVDKGTHIPYATRMGLSLFAMMPLDSTMTPEGIMASQASQKAPEQQNAPGNPPQGQKHSMTALNKLPGAYQTASQAREQRNMKS